MRKSWRVRTTTRNDTVLLPDIERSAGEAFRDVPGLTWIADDSVKSVVLHEGYVLAGTSWVVVNEIEQPIGFLCAGSYGSDLHIWEIAVRRDRQGAGAGRALIEEAVVYARRLGMTRVTLTTFRDVAWNEPLYKHMGFTTLGPEDIDVRLSAVLSNERDQGLPAERRCAMWLKL